MLILVCKGDLNMAKYNMSEQEAEKVFSEFSQKINILNLVENIMGINYSPSQSGGRSMSESKLYAIKKDDMYLDGDGSRSWNDFLGPWSELYDDKEVAQATADNLGGSVATLSESHDIVVPEWFDKWVRSFNGLGEKVKKAVVVSKILQQGYGFSCNDKVLGGNGQYGEDPRVNTEQEIYIADHQQELAIAVMTGNYIIKKEKKYWVKLDGFVTSDGQQQYLSRKNGYWFASRKAVGIQQQFIVSDLTGAPDWVKGLANGATSHERG
ncbi:unknown [Lactobacillus phage Lb338-1]|uniref:Uncharacterized protein n=1 Tax=Lactobacillus phage Lb338-1 TaxID=2892342 RepID=C1KFD0_9CAUD|nr:hypothetical protein lb338_phage_20 [Lactobacillus phage Lb338-1]ACO36941.1 unknown [Lactobacillus phage Lb338-1]